MISRTKSHAYMASQRNTHKSHTGVTDSATLARDVSRENAVGLMTIAKQTVAV